MTSMWQQFLLDYQVSFEASDEQDLRTQEQLSNFEDLNEIKLPSDYKEFCQFFGTGELRDTLNRESNIRIWCPNVQYAQELKESMQILLRYEERTDSSEIKELVNSAFVFANNYRSRIFFWDLRTYSQSDDSYDIYLFPSGDSPLSICKIGRSFFNFIRDFGLSKKSFSKLPKHLRPQKIKSPSFINIDKSVWYHFLEPINSR